MKTTAGWFIKVEAYYGQSRAKIKLNITRSGQLLGRDFD
jgi:hypothetical protein